MIKGYRKRFVQLNMILAETVLAAVLLLLGIYLGYRSREELRFAMRQVLAPVDRLMENGSVFPEGGEKNPLKPDQSENPMGEESAYPGRKNDRRSRVIDLGEDERQISSLVYDPKDGEILMISDKLDLSDAVLQEVSGKVWVDARDFGFLREERLFFYKEMQNSELRVSLAPASVYYTDLFRVILILLGVFLLASGLFLLVSIRLSRYAARPMEQAMEMERQFAADISHDLKTPITVIKANNSILKADPEKTIAEERQWLDSTDAAADSMLSLIGEMLTLSKLDSVSIKEDLIPTDFSSAVLKAVIQLESVAYERKVLVDDRITERIRIRASEEYADRIAAGLLENALKYEPEGGKVTVSLTRHKKTAVFSVQNAGSVIPEEDLPHVFERFYRGDKARSAKEGHGLGLSIIHRITEVLGGEISVRSDASIGTVFTVSLNVLED